MFKDKQLMMTYPSTPTLKVFAEGDPTPPPDKLYKVVASEGQVNDWAAYFETPDKRREGNTLDAVHGYSNKLSQGDAERLFPDWAKRLEYRP